MLRIFSILVLGLITQQLAGQELSFKDGRQMVPLSELNLIAEREHVAYVRLTSTEIPEPVKMACYSVGRVTMQQGNGASMGSSTYLGNGLWLTNRHVVEGGGKASVKLKNGQVIPAKVTSISRSDPDLAVVETEDMDQWIRPIPISNDVPSPGMIVYPSGFDHGKLDQHVCWPAKIIDFFQSGDLVSSGVGPRKGSISGNSGGPTFTSKGELLAPLWGNSGGDTNVGNGTCITVNSFACRTYLLPWRERIMKSITQCGPGGCSPMPQYGGGGSYGGPVQPPSYIIPANPPSYQPAPTQPAQPPSYQPIVQPQPQPQQPAPSTGGIAGPKGDKGDKGDRGEKGDKGDDGEVTDAHLAKIIEGVRKQLAEDPNMRGRDGERGPAGPAGPKGDKGDPGEITAQHLAIIARTLAADPAMRGPAGPAGPAGNVDIDAIVAEVLRRLPSTRVVLVDGQSKKILDDETYQPGEALVFDINKLIRKTQ